MSKRTKKKSKRTAPPPERVQSNPETGYCILKVIGTCKGRRQLNRTARNKQSETRLEELRVTREGALLVLDARVSQPPIR